MLCLRGGHVHGLKPNKTTGNVNRHTASCYEARQKKGNVLARQYIDLRVSEWSLLLVACCWHSGVFMKCCLQPMMTQAVSMFQNVLLGSSKAFFPPCVHHVQCAVTMLGHFLFCPWERAVGGWQMHVEKTDTGLGTVLPLHSVGRRPNNIKIPHLKHYSGQDLVCTIGILPERVMCIDTTWKSTVQLSWQRIE